MVSSRAIIQLWPGGSKILHGTALTPSLGRSPYSRGSDPYACRSSGLAYKSKAAAHPSGFLQPSSNEQYHSNTYANFAMKLVSLVLLSAATHTHAFPNPFLAKRSCSQSDLKVSRSEPGENDLEARTVWGGVSSNADPQAI